MNHSTDLRHHYSNSSIPLQLQHLALNLTRIQYACSGVASNHGTYIIRESQQFIEWTARSLVPQQAEEAEELVNLGRLLSQWKLDWNEICSDPTKKARVARSVQTWSDKLTALADGLT